MAFRRNFSYFVRLVPPCITAINSQNGNSASALLIIKYIRQLKIIFSSIKFQQRVHYIFKKIYSEQSVLIIIYGFTPRNNNFIYMSRFTLSTNNFYATQGYDRPLTSGKTQRIRITSTRQSFLPANTLSHFRPQTGRSSSSSFRNTKGKLEILSDNLSVLLEQVKKTRVNSKEIQLHLNFLKDELTQRGIEPIKGTLTQEIKMLDKGLQIKKRSDMLRYQALHENCRALQRNSREIKGRLQDVNSHLHQIEDLLGYHGVRDKLKY